MNVRIVLAEADNDDDQSQLLRFLNRINNNIYKYRGLDSKGKATFRVFKSMGSEVHDGWSFYVISTRMDVTSESSDVRSDVTGITSKLTFVNDIKLIIL